MIILKVLNFQKASKLLTNEIMIENFCPILKSYYSMINKKVTNPNLITYEIDKLVIDFSNDEKGLFMGE